jgi:NAD(P)-dependent dehydrogenase (short-subunit alcohol dehydrogenase family)
MSSSAPATKQAKVLETSASVDTNKMTTIVLITGANTGIGLSLAKVFSKRPNHLVIGTCRDMTKSKDLLANGCKAVQLDVSNDESCAGLPERLNKEVGVDKIDILINNAGIGIFRNNLTSPTLVKDAMEMINVNTLGPLRVTQAVLPLLRNAAQQQGKGKTPNPVKIVNVSSRMGSIGDNTSGGSYGYRASKAAENIISVSLARDLAKENIISLTVHPGYIKTRMVGDAGDMDPDTCAGLLAKLIDSKSNEEDCYKFWHRDGIELPW